MSPVHEPASAFSDDEEDDGQAWLDEVMRLLGGAGRGQGASRDLSKPVKLSSPGNRSTQAKKPEGQRKAPRPVHLRTIPHAADHIDESPADALCRLIAHSPHPPADGRVWRRGHLPPRAPPPTVPPPSRPLSNVPTDADEWDNGRGVWIDEAAARGIPLYITPSRGAHRSRGPSVYSISSPRVT